MARRFVQARRLICCAVLWGGCVEPAFLQHDAATEARGDAQSSAATDASAKPGNDAQSSVEIAPAGALDAGPRENTSDASAVSAAGSASVDGATAGDASIPATSAASDAASVAPELPAWAKPLLGRYLKRSISIAFDPVISMPVVVIETSLVEFTSPRAGELSMKIDTCSLSTQWADGNARLAVGKPSAVAPMELRVALGEAPHFSTETALSTSGYDASRQTNCPSGAKREKYADQTWITGPSCTCATVPEVLPLSASDCRLTDPDGDRQPGLAAKGSGLAGDYTIVMNTSLKLLDGEVRADREHVLREQRTRNFSCADRVPETCALGSPTPCAELTELRPLGPDATCATVLAQSLPLGDLPLASCHAR